jgi:hypothetical protein
VIAATLVTGTVVGAAVAWPDEHRGSMVAAQIGTAATTAPPVVRDVPPRRDLEVSRSTEREPLEPVKKKPEPPEPAVVKVSDSEIEDHLVMTTDLNLWSGPGEQYELLDVVPAGTKVAVTGDVVDGQWAEVAYEGLSRWVNADYLAEKMPEPEQEEPEARAAGLSSAPCASGSDVESGLVSNAIAVHRAVCAAFPQVTSYGGLRADSGAHGTGQAIDIMITGSTGDQIAEFVRSNAGDLGVSEVIWSQQIWTVERSSEGWRYMEDRGSDTANHYDHV